MLVAPQKTTPPPELHFVEFVALMALLMALTAMSIDVMLPALPQIGRALGVYAENDWQLIITVYVVGFSIGQLIFGPLSDRFGRRRPLLAGLALYIVGTLLALTSGTISGLLLARSLQGFGAAAPRVIATAIVRDKFGGREMARVMSLVMMVFIVVPILAPAVGEGVLQVADWRTIFILLLVAAIGAVIWAGLRLPETSRVADRMPLSARSILSALSTVFSSRQATGYILCLGFIFGLLMSYIVSAEQIFVGIYGLGSRFPLAFGSIASFMVMASIVNATIVRRLGMRGVSHRALLGALIVCGIVALAGYPAKPPLLLFCAFMAVIFFSFGLIMPNFNALAMEPMGHIAGTASSLAGFYSTATGAVFATIIGRSFDGTLRPLFIGITLLVLAAFIVVLFVERFHLARSAPQSGPANPTGAGPMPLSRNK